MRLIDGDALIAELNGIRYPGAPYVDAGIRIAVGKVCDAQTIVDLSICEERYLDLLEYFGGKDDILKDGEEFKKWLERMYWHVLECNKLARELEKKQERKTGRWIISNTNSKVTAYKCSECGRIVYDDAGYDVSKDYPYCHCGADMRGNQK